MKDFFFEIPHCVLWGPSFVKAAAASREAKKLKILHSNAWNFLKRNRITNWVMETCYSSWIQRNKILLGNKKYTFVSKHFFQNSLGVNFLKDSFDLPKRKKRQQTSVFQVSYFFFLWLMTSRSAWPLYATLMIIVR